MLHIRKRKSFTQKTKVADEKGDSDETWTIIIIIIIEHMCVFEYYDIGPIYIQLPVVCPLHVAITVDYYICYMIRLCQSEFYF
jgi:hypothetical protein